MELHSPQFFLTTSNNVIEIKREGDKGRYGTDVTSGMHDCAVGIRP